MSKRVRINQEKHEMSPNVLADYEWLRQHRSDLYQKYGECVVLIYQQQVIGAGATITTALEDAEQNLPPDLQEPVTPIAEVLGELNFPFRATLSEVVF